MERFAGYPAPYVYAEPGGKKVQQLLWGDWVEATAETLQGHRRVAKARNSTGWMREEDLQKERLLEVNFVDVGQGDGCLVVTPNDRFIVIDAGQHDNLFWYLRWRFNLRNNPDRVIHIDHAVITHPDADHYGGFAPILESPQFTIGTLHHNGIVERAGTRRLGPEVADDGRRYLADIVQSKPALRKLLRDDTIVGRMPYPKLLRGALATGRVDDVKMLSSREGFLPDFNSGDLVIQVLGPVPERVNRKLVLRRLGDDGITKNGHSVVLTLRYKDVTMALGGDLNTESQRYLLHRHAGVDVQALEGVADDVREAAIAAAREVFRVDVAKSCHHGSGDIEDVFLEATDAIATVISSGDNESYAHPRPDALGVTGKYGRGRRPLIFSTELARSVNVLDRPETIRRVAGTLLDEERAVLASTGATAEETPGRLVAQYQRALAVYGLITLRTDGKSVLVAQKLEKASGAREFDYHCIERADGELAYNPDR